MTYRKGNYYHIYNRGCNKELVFFSDENYQYLISQMEQTIAFYNVRMVAYCLMPNHYHFLMKQISDNPISNWLRYVFNPYTQKVNAEIGRGGTLFEGRAKHILIDKEEYLAHLIRYIHYNPVKAGLVSSPKEWKCSNYLEWIGKRKSLLFDEETLKLVFGDYHEYESFVSAYHISRELEDEIGKYTLE